MKAGDGSMDRHELSLSGSQAGGGGRKPGQGGAQPARQAHRNRDRFYLKGIQVKSPRQFISPK